MSRKFGLLVDFDLLKVATSTNTKPVVWGMDDVIFPQWVLRFGQNSVA